MPQPKVNVSDPPAPGKLRLPLASQQETMIDGPNYPRSLDLCCKHPTILLRPTWHESTVEKLENVPPVTDHASAVEVRTCRYLISVQGIDSHLNLGPCGPNGHGVVNSASCVVFLNSSFQETLPSKQSRVHEMMAWESVVDPCPWSSVLRSSWLAE
jgi:hypothetical protein